MTMERICLQKFLVAACAASSKTPNQAPGVLQVPSYTCLRKEEGVRAEGGRKRFRTAAPLGLYTEIAESVP